MRLEPVRSWWLGLGRPEKAAVAAYTHLNELRRHYGEAVRREWAPLVAVILERLQALRTA